jgi:tetratricopeptide (TPR) repeat protein
MNFKASNFFRYTKVLFLLFCVPFFAQTNNNKNINLQKLDLKKLTTLFFENEKNPTQQRNIANAYLAIAKKEKRDILIAKAFYMFSLLDKRNKAIPFLDSVIKYSKNTNDKNFPITAYIEQGFFLNEQFKFKEAMQNYLIAEKLALKTNNIDYLNNIKRIMAYTKSECLGEVDEALVLYKECYDYYKTKDFRKEYAPNYQNVVFGIADVYKSLRQSDSATHYNKIGYLESKLSKDEEMQYLFVLNEGANQTNVKNYKVALDSIAKALPKMIQYGNTGNTLAAYYYRGKAYVGLGKKDLAALNYAKVDSINQVYKGITSEFVDGYPFLIAYYKGKGDSANQLKYMTTYMTIDSTLQKNYKELSKKLHKDYEIPHLMQSKQTLIDSLQHSSNKLVWGIGILLVFLALVASYAMKQQRQKKQFQTLLNNNHQPPTINEQPAPTNHQPPTTKPKNPKLAPILLLKF